ncbi:VolA/Pla-1 family phospholipase [Pseudoalteromonas piscicida]|uniref:VolA/Pla-1 family phospholipase n=1 Tax=Pseudoalteromonas piscicida TaxID=43662 RepID=UPI001C939068|nr:VolA/Pla-1 family phospholipase [Pseudoalteromonas piscicida]QZO11487.1 lipase [Pseudoalteromonas piscicida]
MKKMLLSLAVSAALAGCGGGETLEDVKNDTTPVSPTISVKFDPSGGVISVPNDILLSGTQDGTLNLPDEMLGMKDGEGNPLVTRASYANPSIVIGALDGWSTQMPYVIDMTTPNGLTLDAQSVMTPGAVRIFEVAMGGPLQTDEQCAQLPSGIACKFVAELEFGPQGDFVAMTNGAGNGIVVVPVKPFKPSTTYITVLTRTLKDSSGQSVDPSSTYTLLRQNAPLVTDAQKSLQAVIQSYEEVVTKAGVDGSEIIYTAAMTTQSTGAGLAATKALLAQSLAKNAPPVIAVPAQAPMTVADALEGKVPAALLPAFQQIKLMRGVIQLPQYLAKPKTGGIEALADTYWQALCDSPVTLGGYVAQGGQLPQVTEGDDQLCASLPVPEGVPKFRSIGVDKQRFITQYNPIPKQQWLANMPVQITFPANDAARPESGWPVVILQHGITSKKEDMLGLTLSLTQAGFATVAIDHPMHGERGIDIDGDGNDEFNASTGSVLSYMNLTSLLVARDNLKQSAADLMGLRLGLNFINQASGGQVNFNTQQVSYLGHSLGSVVGPSFLAQTNAPLNPAIDGFFKVESAALASGGSGIANFLIESKSFGPFVQGSVLSSAGNLASQAFNAYLQEGAIADCGTFAADQSKYVSCAYGTFRANLEAAGDTATLALIDGTVTQFGFAAQTALGSADPLNYAASVKALQTPVYMSVVTGGVDGNAADLVIPPTTERSFLSGSLPLAGFMGLMPASETQISQDGTPGSYVVKFSQGHHSSILTTGFDEKAGGTAAGHAAASIEMQTQVASFLKSKGLVLQVSNPDVVAN